MIFCNNFLTIRNIQDDIRELVWVVKTFKPPVISCSSRPLLLFEMIIANWISKSIPNLKTYPAQKYGLFSIKLALKVAIFSHNQLSLCWIRYIIQHKLPSPIKVSLSEPFLKNFLVILNEKLGLGLWAKSTSIISTHWKKNGIIRRNSFKQRI